jgi:fructose-1,6-bisphosphatase/inositol monophosphatase family enzyme
LAFVLQRRSRPPRRFLQQSDRSDGAWHRRRSSGRITKAGRALARDFGEVENLQVSVKGPAEFVSAADRKADATLIAELERTRPGYGFLTEETGTVAGKDATHR